MSAIFHASDLLSKGKPAPKLMLAVLALSLLVRLLIPAGWMPAHIGGVIKITMCSEGVATPAWVDRDGKVHKSNPADGHDAADGSCVFAPMAAQADMPDVLAFASVLPPVDQPLLSRPTVTIGQGLVAPPPPSTGPPALL
jgi:hypothetical protein